MGHDSVTLDVFAKVVKVMNQTELWDVMLAWYSPSATHWIYLYGLEHNFKINACPIAKVFATWAKFPEPLGNHNVTKYSHLSHN